MERMDPRFNDQDDSAEAEHFYPCACGDPDCVADDRDGNNYKIRGEWYAADCEHAKYHPDVVGEVMAAIRADELQDDFNKTRR